MSVKHWLAGFAFCFAGIGGAAATSVDSRELDNSARGSSDSSAHDAGIGDLQGTSRENGARSHASEGSKSSSSAIERNNPDGASSTHTAPRHLGWQSLLPGSIQ